MLLAYHTVVPLTHFTHCLEKLLLGALKDKPNQTQKNSSMIFVHLNPHHNTEVSPISGLISPEFPSPAKQTSSSTSAVGTTQAVPHAAGVTSGGISCQDFTSGWDFPAISMVFNTAFFQTPWTNYTGYSFKDDFSKYIASASI